VARGAVDFLQPDVARAGGITEIRKIAALAAKHNVIVSFHTWGDAVALAASLHQSGGLRECGGMELAYSYNPHRAGLLKERHPPKNGFMTPPDKPGLGVELDLAALQRFAFTGTEEIVVRLQTLRAG